MKNDHHSKLNKFESERLFKIIFMQHFDSLR